MRKNVPFQKMNVSPEWIGLKRILRVSALCIAMSFFVTQALSQAQLLVDINQIEDLQYNEYSKLVDVEGTLYFVVRGGELWKSNMTSAGIERVKEFSSISAVRYSGSTLYLSADDGTSGMELWKVSGATCVRVKDIAPGSSPGNPINLTDVNGVLYFTASISGAGTELWKSDGTESGTFMVKDILPKGGSSKPSHLANVNGTLYFAANDATNGIELWKSDGTTAGTVMVKDIYPGTRQSSAPTMITQVNGIAYFIASDGVSGRELWKSDGTDTGTVMVKEIRAGSGTPGIKNMIAVNSTLFFSASDGMYGHELWKSDGTPEGTVMVKDMTPGSAGSDDESGWGTDIANFANVNGTLFYSANLYSNHYIWKSDGTEPGTVPLQPADGPGIGELITPFIFMNGYIYYFTESFVGNDEDSYSLFRMNADGRNPQRLQSFAMIDAYEYYWPRMVKVGNSIYYYGRDNRSKGFKLFKTNGEPNAAVELYDVYDSNSGSFARDYVNVNGIVYFGTHYYPEYYYEEDIWRNQFMRTDGTPEGTFPLVDDLEVQDIEQGNNVVFVSGYDMYQNTWQLWKTDGTTEGTANIKLFDYDYGNYRQFSGELTYLNGNVYFYNSYGELWKSDGTYEGTAMLRDFHKITFMEKAGGYVLFRVTTDSNGEELWRTNGTAAGTVKYKTMRTDGGARVPRFSPAATIGTTHYFVANDGVHGNEIWRTRGTLGTTAMVADMNTIDTTQFTYEFDISAFGVFRDTLYFSAIGQDHKWGLYKLNGTNGSPVKLATTRLISQLIPAGNALYLITEGEDPVNTELWITDGTAAGTRMVKTLDMSLFQDIDTELVNDVLYFIPANGGRSPAPISTLWRTDGTECGTFPVLDGYSITYSDMSAIGSRLIFTAVSTATTPGGTGPEPHTYNTDEAPLSPCGPPAIAETPFVRESEEIMTSYPNPFTSNFALRISGKDEEIADVKVFTASGMPIETINGLRTNSDHQLGQSWPPGLYIVKVNRKGEVTNHMVIKK